MTVLAEVGRALAAQVTAAVPGWVRRSVAHVLATTGATAALDAAVETAAAEASGVVGSALAELAEADVDAHRSTPLEIVRDAVRFPTAVLRQAGVAPVRRERFAVERFPDDLYGLTPASLAALDPSLADVAVAWGAAKAMAHRARHRPSGPGVAPA